MNPNDLPDFIPVGGSPGDFVGIRPRGFQNNRRFGRGRFNDRGGGFGGRGGYRGRQYHGNDNRPRGQHWHPYEQGPSNYQPSYQVRGGRGNFRSQHQGNEDISLYCKNALENPWAKLESGQSSIQFHADPQFEIDPLESDSITGDQVESRPKIDIDQSISISDGSAISSEIGRDQAARSSSNLDEIDLKEDNDE